VRNDTPQIDQDFAIVISGNLENQGTGIVHLDRAKYKIPSTANVTLIDTNRSGNGSPVVSFTSTTENIPEVITVVEGAIQGMFAGSIPLDGAPPSHDGTLQVSPGDTIEAKYSDSDPQRDVTDTSVIDTVPPHVTGRSIKVAATTCIITWFADEQSTGRIYYGKTPALGLSSSDTLFSVSHSVKLNGLEPGTTYFYDNAY
jgi:hypothetical protein